MKFVKEAGGVEIYKSDIDLIKKGNLDGVVINSPHTIHFSQIKLALENGINVLVEKPAVVNYKEAQEVKKILKKPRKFSWWDTSATICRIFSVQKRYSMKKTR